jgi:hypothetical protein
VTLVRSLSRALTILVGIAALGFALAVAVAPTQVIVAVPPLEPVVDATRDLDGTLVLAGAAVTVGLLATYFARSGRTTEETVDRAMDARKTRPPETVTVDPGTVTGDAIQREYDDIDSPEDLDDVIPSLRRTAVAVERAVTSADSATASERVAHGKWTDDTLAAAVLGEAVPIPVTARLRGWLDPESETRRRLARVVEAVETRLANGADTARAGKEKPAPASEPDDSESGGLVVTLADDASRTVDESRFGDIRLGSRLDGLVGGDGDE